MSVDDGKVTLSTIFKWYRDDFGETEEDVLAYLARYHEGLQKLLEANTRYKVAYDYDWGLNAHVER